jgi:hypothetical protein
MGRRIAILCLVLLLIPMTTGDCRDQSTCDSGALVAAAVFVPLALPRGLALIGRVLLALSET